MLVVADAAGTAAIRGRIMDRSLDIAFIDAQLVPGVLAVHVAANKALAGAARGKQSAASLHAELVHCLHAGRNVGEALRLLSPAPAPTAATAASTAPTATSLLLAVFDATDAQMAEIAAMAAGVPTDPREYYSRPASVRRDAVIALYKITAAAELGPATANTLEDCVIHRIATQDLQN